MKSTKLFLALASSILLASCNLGAENAKTLTFAEAQATASEIIKATKDEKYVFPTKLTGELKATYGDEEASIKFITDTEKQCFYTKIDSKEIEDSQVVTLAMEEWSYKEGDTYISAISAVEDGKTQKYYVVTNKWDAEYTAESFVKLSAELLDEIVEAKAEEDFFDETEGLVTSATYKSTGKGSFIMEASGEEGASVKIVIKDNLLADLEVKQDDMVESYHVTYGKAEFTKPDLTKFEKYDFE